MASDGELEERDVDVVLTGRPTRRQMLAMAGSASTIALAGCGQSPDEARGGPAEDNGPSGPTKTPVEDSDLTFRGTEFWDPTKTNYNQYDSPDFPPSWSSQLIFGRLFGFTDNAESSPGFVKELAEDWYIEGDTLTIELDDRYTWHNGDPVRARDLVTQLQLDNIAEKQKWDLIESVREADQHAVEITLIQGGEVNKNVLLSYFANEQMAVKHELYEQFLPEEDASGYDKRLKLTDLLDLNIGNRFAQEGYEHPVGWGPFKHVEQSNRFIILERYEDYPIDINFPKYEMEYFSTNQAKYQALISENLSGNTGTPKSAVYSKIPDKYKQYVDFTRLGWALSFNYQAERKASNPDLFKDRRVRQALSFALDRDILKENSGVGGNAVRDYKLDSGWIASEDEHADFVGEGWVQDTLTQYNTDRERATQLLEEAGWSKDDGKWYDAKDNRARFEFTTTSGQQTLVNYGQTIVSQWSDFGIDVKFRAQDIITYFGQTNPQSRYDVNHWIAGGAAPFPYGALRLPWGELSLESFPQENNHPLEVEVPFPIGDPDGDLEPVNMEDLTTEIKQTPEDDAERLQELYRKGMWTYNQWLPVWIPTASTITFYINSNKWTSPEKGTKHAGARDGLYHWIHQGLVQAKE